MNYFDCVRLQKMISEQALTVAELQDNSVSVSSGRSDGMPKSSSPGSGIERKVERLTVEEAKLEHLKKQLDCVINSIPDRYIRKLICLRIFKNKSWNWIACKVGGNTTGNGIRMLCVRYKWEFSTDC